MVYNFRLFWRMAVRSFIGTRDTHGQLTRHRLIFILLFYTVWPAYTVFTWLCFLLDDLLFPGYKMQPLDKPLFITGNFRSGSTFLHRILAKDHHTFTSMRTWDIYFTPSVTQRKLAHLLSRVDALFGAPIHRLLKRIDQRSLGQVTIHPISLFEPEEDENILLHAWSTMFVGFLFPFLNELPPYEYFDDQLPAADRRRIMLFYRSLIQRHVYAAGRPLQYVAKNPAFSAKIASLVEAIPEARIVYLVRTPLEMLPSTISWLAYVWHVFGQSREIYPFRERIFRFTQYWYNHPLEYLDQHPSPNYCILKYDDLINDPAHIVYDLYQRFGYPQSPVLENIVAEAVIQNTLRRSPHRYSFTEMGFTRHQINAAYAPIFNRFGFDPAEAPHPVSPAAQAVEDERRHSPTTPVRLVASPALAKSGIAPEGVSRTPDG